MKFIRRTSEDIKEDFLEALLVDRGLPIYEYT